MSEQWKSYYKSACLQKTNRKEITHSLKWVRKQIQGSTALNKVEIQDSNQKTQDNRNKSALVLATSLVLTDIFHFLYILKDFFLNTVDHLENTYIDQLNINCQSKWQIQIFPDGSKYVVINMTEWREIKAWEEKREQLGEPAGLRFTRVPAPSIRGFSCL